MRVEGTRTGRMRGNVRVENGVSKETGTRSVQAEDPWRTRRDDDARRVRRVRKEETGSGRESSARKGENHLPISPLVSNALPSILISARGLHGPPQHPATRLRSATRCQHACRTEIQPWSTPLHDRRRRARREKLRVLGVGPRTRERGPARTG